MVLLETTEFVRSVNEWSFFISLVVAIVFYQQYKECMRNIRKEEMLDQFLNDK